MKFSFSRLLVVTAFLALLSGWCYDHQRLTEVNQRINAEVASLYREVVGKGHVTAGWFDPIPQGRVYDWAVERDRTEYRLNFGFKPNAQTVND
jgi:hypothetical protein